MSRRSLIQTAAAGVAGAVIGAAGMYFAKTVPTTTLGVTTTTAPEEEKPKEKITIGFGYVIKALPYYKAEFATKMLKEAGYDVELVYFTPRAVREAFFTRKAQIASVSAPAIYVQIEQGQDIVAAPNTGIVELVLVANEKYPDAESLRGKRIGIGQIGAYEHAAINAYLRERNIEAEYIQIGESKERANALLSGRIDAAGLLFSDALSLLEQKAPVKILDSLHVFWVLNWVYRDWAEENSRFMVDWFKAHILFAQWALQYRSRYIEEAIEWMGLEKTEEIRKKQEAVYDWLLDREYFHYILAPIEEYEILMKWTLDSGEIKSMIPLERFLDLPNKFLEQAFNELRPK
ncbi:MAG: twin-arginine translocation signal domain-containing protein [Nitrososphaerota archaeon]